MASGGAPMESGKKTSSTPPFGIRKYPDLGLKKCSGEQD
jgi:hypothetical protein